MSEPLCKQPVVWKAICKQCGREICRFCSEVDEAKIVAGEAVSNAQMAYKDGKFAAFPIYFTRRRQEGETEDPCCQLKDISIVSEEWVNADLFCFLTELAVATKTVSDAAHKLGQLRKYLDSGKISPKSFDVMYENLLAIMQSMNQLANERYDISYMGEKAGDINF
jgi:hypothetical protein